MTTSAAAAVVARTATIGGGSSKNGDNISGKSADDLDGKDGVCQREQGLHQPVTTTAAAAIQ